VPTAAGLRLITIATIDWAIFTGLERHLRLTTAACARCGIHRACLAVAEAAAATATLTATAVIRATTGLLARRPALGATARCIGQTTAGIKFLLACGKSEFLIAVATIQNLIGQGVSRFLTCYTLQQKRVCSVLRTITLVNFLVKHLSSFFLATSARDSTNSMIPRKPSGV
jgi:hypothetical protein